MFHLDILWKKQGVINFRMYSIGKFSIISRISVKSLRRYHEMDLLVPEYVDDDSGYRYYNDKSLEKADIIRFFREIDISLNEIKVILSEYNDDNDLLEFLELKKEEIQDKINNHYKMKYKVEDLIKSINRNSNIMSSSDNEIREKNVEEFLFAGYRMKGKYNEIGKAFAIVGKKANRHIIGSGMGLFYDKEYKEEGADFEGGFPVKKEIKSENIDTRLLSGGKVVYIIHHGSYDSIGNSYKKLFHYIDKKKVKDFSHCREIYLKGPGMIFKGNPNKYVTEIQIFVS